MIEALESLKAYKFNGLSLVPKGGVLVLEVRGLRGPTPKQVRLNEQQALKLASLVRQAARQLGKLK